MSRSVEDLNKFCYEFENSYYMDNDITSIFNNGVTPENILYAARIIREKEKSRFLKLPVDFKPVVKSHHRVNLDELPHLIDQIYKNEVIQATLKSIESADNEVVMLRVLGPFSALMEEIDSNTLFRWLYRHKSEMHLALSKVTEALAAYIKLALDKGVKIISFAEPSALAEVIGEERYIEFVIHYTVKLLKELEQSLDNSIVHLCPRTSHQLERYGFVTKEDYNCDHISYAQALDELSRNRSVRYIGHRCINAEHTKVDKIYVLKIL